LNASAESKNSISTAATSDGKGSITEVPSFVEELLKENKRLEELLKTTPISFEPSSLDSNVNSANGM
jgi:hypothetical protein